MKDKQYKKEWVKIGECGVDSGQLLIIDPCYLSSWKDGEYAGEDKKSDNSYARACGITVSGNSAGEVKEGGVVFASGYGDGCYPVMAYYNADSRITQIKIKMG